MAAGVMARPRRRRWRSHAGSLAFLVPGAIWLLVIVVYPMVDTVRFSFFNESGTAFVGTRNYQTVFTDPTILTTFRNNAIWVIVFPFTVTALGLLFALLTERIRWSTAFKTMILMPVVFSATASALVWRAIFDLDPQVGMVNAAVQAVSDWVVPPGVYPVNTSAGQTVPSLAASGLRAGPHGTLLSRDTVAPGHSIRVGMIGIEPATLTLLGARRARVPAPATHAVTGLVWRDFSPSHPAQTGAVFPDEDGLPLLRVSLLRSDGSAVASTQTDRSGDFRFSNVSAGQYRVRVDASNFSSGFQPIFWLGTQSLTPTGRLDQTAQALLSVPLVDIAMIIAYLWMWAGFAMVLVAAGLSALDRSVLEAAHVDGASEWQTFRRVTMPMLAPVLTVILVTMVINVLKVFDIILNMAPGSSQGAANTLALEMYNDGFTGGIHSGLSSAVAVILFVLVVPAMLFNLRRIRG